MSAAQVQLTAQTRVCPPSSGDMRVWYACLSCKLLQTLDQFSTNGCPNCPDSQLHLLKDPQNPDHMDSRKGMPLLTQYVTKNWKGMVCHLKQGGWLKKALQAPIRSDAVLGSYAAQAIDPLSAKERAQLEYAGQLQQEAEFDEFANEQAELDALNKEMIDDDGLGDDQDEDLF